MYKKELMYQLEQLKKDLEVAVSEKNKKDITEAIKALEAKIPDTKSLETGVTEVKDQVTKITEWQVKKDEADKKNQEALDQIIAGQKEQKGNKSTKSFTENFSDLVKENWEEISRVSK
jgi:predicted phage tail protein